MELPKYIRVGIASMKLIRRYSHDVGFYWRDNGQWGCDLSIYEIENGEAEIYKRKRKIEIISEKTYLNDNHNYENTN